MKKHFYFRLGLAVLAAAGLALAGCNRNTDAPAPVAATPTGVSYTTLRQGTVVVQDRVSSGGGVAVVKDSDGNE